MKDNLFAIWLSLKCGVGSTEFLPLIEKFGSPYSVFGAEHDELVAAGVPVRLAERLSDKNLDEAYSILNFCEQNNVTVSAYGDGIYPVSLRALSNPPIVLYIKGTVPDLSHKLSIGIVGKRNMSEYGMQSAYRISYELASANVVVVSGMALGIDGTASGAAIAAGGQTVAVLGSGIDVVYPKQHIKLMENIIRHGCVMTEFAPGTPPMGQNFPVRNRIISGLSQGVLIVEADENSGAMITAKTALLQGRELFAIPGNIGQSSSAGTNQLLHDGAIMVLRARDIVDEFEYLYKGLLDVSRLAAAERRSDPNVFKLRELGVASGSEIPGFESNAAVRHTPATGRVAAPAPELKIQPDEEKTQVTPKKEAKADKSLEKRALLTERQRKIFDEMPMDKAIPAEEMTKLGFNIGEIMSALTVLEIYGLVTSLPGGLYTRS